MPELEKPQLRLEAGRVASQFIDAVASGKAREAALFGPRGEGKTISCGLAVVTHAKVHEEHKYKLPVPWMCIAETFETHKAKTVPSLKEPLWQGAWQFTDADHRGVFKTNKEAVVVDFFGIEDAGAIDRVRRGTCGMWAEEVAPATSGPGVPELAWLTGLTSQRVPSHCKPAIFSSNLPDARHWTWKRFMPLKGATVGHHPDHLRRMYFRIPKGENRYIDDVTRVEWREDLAGRPDLIARLLDGEPESVQMGRAVATQYINGKPVGFNEEVHVSKERLRVVKGVPFYLGQDGGFCPVTTISQQYDGRLWTYASLVIESGMKQQYEMNVLPWFKQYAPWAIKSDEFIKGTYDPASPDDESDRDRNPIDIIRQSIGGYWEPGPVDWEARKNALLASFNKKSIGTDFSPWVILDPIGCETLIDALRGRWYYKEDRFGNIASEKAHKPNVPFSDAGDSYTYMVCGALPEFTRTKPKHQGRIFTGFDARFLDDRRFPRNRDIEDAEVIDTFDPRRA